MSKIAILVEKIYEDLELQYPRLRLDQLLLDPELPGDIGYQSYKYFQRPNDELGAYRRIAKRSARMPIVIGSFAVLVAAKGS